MKEQNEINMIRQDRSIFICKSTVKKNININKNFEGHVAWSKKSNVQTIGRGARYDRMYGGIL